MFGNAPACRLQIKICGITNEADAAAAIESGADAIGINLYPGSKRYVDLTLGRKWIEKLPGTICRVAVMVNPDLAFAIQVGQLSFINGLQLHGQESSDFCRLLTEGGIEFAKGLPANDQPIADLGSFGTNLFVLDSSQDGQFGGSGKTFRWD